MKKITKKEAIKAGLDKFYTGKLCKNGHQAERTVSSGNCMSCTVVNMKNWHDRQTPEKVKENRAKAKLTYDNRTPEKVEYDKKLNKAWRIKNSDKWKEYYKGWFNENRVQHNLNQKDYYLKKKEQAAD